MKEFEAQDWFHIQGRGNACIVHAPEEQFEVGENIRVDGDHYVIYSIETAMRRGLLGLLVKRPREILSKEFPKYRRLITDACKFLDQNKDWKLDEFLYLRDLIDHA